MEIPLTRGQITIVDDDTHEFLTQWKWNAFKTNFGQFYAVRTDCSGPKPKVIRMHRLLMPDHPELEIDHINGNPLDNRRENLRYVTRSQNQMNRVTYSWTRSGIKGVSWDNNSNSWRIRIMVDGKSMTLGYAKELEIARQIRLEGERTYHGEYARTLSIY